MTEEEKKASANRSDIAVTVGTLGAAGAAAVLGMPAEAGTILSASGALLTLSKGLHHSDLMHRVQGWLGSVPALHVARIFHRVNERVVEEQIEVDPVNMIDLLRTASQFVADAATEEKRRMMEEVIINGARRSKDAAAQIEATEALSALSQMPDSSALMFAQIVSEIASSESGHIRKADTNCGLSLILLEDAFRYLKGEYEYSNGIAIETRPSLIIEVAKSDNVGGRIKTGDIVFSDFGAWLADWITNNPAPRPEAKEASPTE